MAAIEDRAKSSDGGNLGCWLGMRMKDLNGTQGKSLDSSTRNTIDTIITLTWTLRYTDLHHVYPIHLLALGLMASWERWSLLFPLGSSRRQCDMFINRMSQSVDLAVAKAAATGDASVTVVMVPPLLLACQSYMDLLMATHRHSEALVMAKKLRPLAEGLGLRMGIKRDITAQFLRHASNWVTKIVGMSDDRDDVIDSATRDEVVGMAVMALDMMEEEYRAGNNLSLTGKMEVRPWLYIPHC